jgi:hypothetical protein
MTVKHTIIDDFLVPEHPNLGTETDEAVPNLAAGNRLVYAALDIDVEDLHDLRFPRDALCDRRAELLGKLSFHFVD